MSHTAAQQASPDAEVRAILEKAHETYAETRGWVPLLEEKEFNRVLRLIESGRVKEATLRELESFGAGMSGEPTRRLQEEYGGFPRDFGGSGRLWETLSAAAGRKLKKSNGDQAAR